MAIPVGLFGFYGYGNFGDDLMSVIIAMYLTEKGFEPLIHGSGCEYAEQQGFQTVETVEELIQRTKAIVFGGGGLLVSWKSSHLAQQYRQFNENMEHHQRQAKTLLSTAKRQGVPIFAISVGGDGSCPQQIVPEYKQKVLEASTFITVRNKEDVKLLRKSGTPGVYLPDIAWLTSSIFPLNHTKDTKVRIGIDMYVSNLQEQRAWYIPRLVQALTLRYPDIDFVFIDTTNSNKAASGASHWPCLKSNSTMYQFHDLGTDLTQITSLDLLISTRLHLGVVCLSYGIPFISLFGEKKTKLFMKNTGILEYFFNNRSLTHLLGLLFRRKRLLHLIKHWQVPHRDMFIRQSRKNLDLLAEKLHCI